MMLLFSCANICLRNSNELLVRVQSTTPVFPRKNWISWSSSVFFFLFLLFHYVILVVAGSRVHSCVCHHRQSHCIHFSLWGDKTARFTMALSTNNCTWQAHPLNKLTISVWGYSHSPFLGRSHTIPFPLHLLSIPLTHLQEHTRYSKWWSWSN